MANHGFVAHFNVQNLGTYPLTSPWLDAWKDVGVPLHLSVEASSDDPQEISFFDSSPPATATWSFLRDMGVATAAFPIGLPARSIEITPSHLGMKGPSGTSLGGALPWDLTPGEVTLSGDIEGKDFDEKMAFVASDGGVLNNEPFEYAEHCLMDQVTLLNKRGPHSFSDAKSAVIMVDPFPEGPEPSLPPDVPQGALSLFSYLPKLVSTYMQHVRFKPSLLSQTPKQHIGLRYLIMPSRTDVHVKYQGGEALASGILGGFGAFLDESFREHDFQLGRHNAYSFLSRYFNLDSQHPLTHGSGRSPHQNAAHTPILLPAETKAIVQPKWPRISQETFEDIVRGSFSRLTSVQGVAADTVPSRLLSYGLNVARILSRWWLKPRLVAAIGGELIRKDQLEDLKDLKRLEREVLAVLFKSPKQRFYAEQVAYLLMVQNKDMGKVNSEDVLAAFRVLEKRRDAFRIKQRKKYPMPMYQSGYRLKAAQG
ncbi:MAG: hypothetical protein MK042_05355 [Cognatishimia sp.]|nr:hypothetical protein [Cognatishimia sp.]